MSTILPHMVWPQCEFRMHVWNTLHMARCKYRTQESRQKSPSGHHCTNCRAISSKINHVSTIGKYLLSSNISSTCPHNMVNFGPLAAEIILLVWHTPANFNGFCALAALLHDTLVVDASQTLRRWTEGATFIRHCGHHVGHWPTFLVLTVLMAGCVSDVFFSSVTLAEWWEQHLMIWPVETFFSEIQRFCSRTTGRRKSEEIG